MGGAGWVGIIDVNDEDVRHVHGTVSMLPDGNVRWSIVSRRFSRLFPLPLLDFCVVPIYNVGLDSSVPRHSDGGQCAHNLFASHDPKSKSSMPRTNSSISSYLLEA